MAPLSFAVGRFKRLGNVTTRNITAGRRSEIKSRKTSGDGAWSSGSEAHFIAGEGDSFKHVPFWWSISGTKQRTTVRNSGSQGTWTMDLKIKFSSFLYFCVSLLKQRQHIVRNRPHKPTEILHITRCWCFFLRPSFKKISQPFFSYIFVFNTTCFGSCPVHVRSICNSTITTIIRIPY